MSNEGKTVYSTEWGRMCPNCGKPVKDCVCKQSRQSVKTDGFVRLQRQSKGRNGKPVTLISGVPLDGKDLQDLHKELKRLCGSGGTIKDGVMEIQGDHRDKLNEVLGKKGYKVKMVGG
jgi:translation initiation factor 1